MYRFHEIAETIHDSFFCDLFVRPTNKAATKQIN